MEPSCSALPTAYKHVFVYSTRRQAEHTHVDARTHTLPKSQLTVNSPGLLGAFD